MDTLWLNMPDQTVNPFGEAQNKAKESQDSAAKPNEREDFAKHVGDEVRSKAVSKGQMAGLREGIENKPQDAPVNPFQQGAQSLPPSGYEDLDEKAKDAKPQVKPEVAADSNVLTVPVNPFDITTATPVRPIDSRPLEEKEKVDFGSVSQASEPEKKVEKPEETGEAKEVQQVGAEEAAGVEEAVVGEVVDKQEKAKSENVQPIEPEIVDVTPPSLENLTEAEPEEFKEELWDILEHAGITKKRILYFFVFVALVVVAVVFLFSSGGGEDAESQVVVEKEAAKEEEVVVEVVEGDAADLETAYIFGLEHQPIVAQPVVTWGSTAGYEAGFIFGNASDLKEHAFVQRVELVRKLDNMYRTDIYNFVNLATDRRAALTSHLRELDELIKDGQAAVVALNVELEDLSVNYTKISEQRDAQEVVFFDQLNALLGQSSYDNLQVFVESGQLALKLKADFRAKEVLRDKLVVYLGALEPRYADISANFEALVKGVRVFDVPDSDIDAIVPVE